jgi:tetratricopeptide (TPR) repeat protein
MIIQQSSSMRRFFLAAALLLSLYVQAQVDLAPGFRVLYEQQQYDRIIGYKAGSNELMSAKALYYIAMAHYMKQDDAQALRYFDQALQKGPADGDMYYYKGMTLLYGSKPADAVPLFAQAIALQPLVPDFWAGKGEALIAQGANDSARYYFVQATALPGSSARHFVRLGDLYNGLQDYDKAIEAYKGAVERAAAGTESWQHALYNEALTEYLSGKAAAARGHFETLLASSPNDYKAMTKLLQCCYALGDIEKGKELKAALYNAYKEKKLPADMKDMFCYDQFLWDGRRVLAYEKFDVGDGFLKVKYLFYILDAEGKTDYRVQAESSPAVEMAGKDAKYVLCLVNKSGYFTYWSFVFNDEVAYPDLKRAVVEILDGKSKSGSSTRTGGN